MIICSQASLFITWLTVLCKGTLGNLWANYLAWSKAWTSGKNRKPSFREREYKSFICFGWERPEAGSLLSRCWLWYFLGPPGPPLSPVGPVRHWSPCLLTISSHNVFWDKTLLLQGAHFQFPCLSMSLNFETHEKKWVLTFFFHGLYSSFSFLPLLLLSFLYMFLFPSFLSTLLPLRCFSFSYYVICSSSQCVFSHCHLCIYWLSWHQGVCVYLLF